MRLDFGWLVLFLEGFLELNASVLYAADLDSPAFVSDGV